MSSLLFVINSLLVSVIKGESYDGCIFDITDKHGITATYDLTLFQLDDSVFEVDDKEQDLYSYKFNICGHIHKPQPWKDSIPTECKYPSHNNGPCATIINGACYENIRCSISTAKASAVQFDESVTPNQCYWLGMELNTSSTNEACVELNENTFSVELYNTGNSAGGIIYSITNGEWCSAGGINRRLDISLQCPDMTSDMFDPMEQLERILNETVTESPICVYHIEYQSPLACPSTCVYQHGSYYGVCNAHGICVSDPILNEVKCLCDDGWSGDMCTDSYSDILFLTSGHREFEIAIIVCAVFTFIAVVIAIYLYYVLRSKPKIVSFDMIDEIGQEFEKMEDESMMMVDDGKVNVGDVGRDYSELVSKVERDTFNRDISVDSDVTRDITKQESDSKEESDDEVPKNEV